MKKLTRQQMIDELIKHYEENYGNSARYKANLEVISDEMVKYEYEVVICWPSQEA